VVIRQAFAVALLPVADQLGIEAAGPGDPTFKEREAQAGETTGYAAEEGRFAHRLGGVGEVADVVVNEVRRRVATGITAALAVGHDRDLELGATLPERVVVMRAVDAEGIDHGYGRE